MTTSCPSFRIGMGGVVGVGEGWGVTSAVAVGVGVGVAVDVGVAVGVRVGARVGLSVSVGNGVGVVVGVGDGRGVGVCGAVGDAIAVGVGVSLCSRVGVGEVAVWVGEPASGVKVGTAVGVGVADLGSSLARTTIVAVGKPVLRLVYDSNPAIDGSRPTSILTCWRPIIALSSSSWLSSKSSVARTRWTSCPVLANSTM